MGRRFIAVALLAASWSCPSRRPVRSFTTTTRSPGNRRARRVQSRVAQHRAVLRVSYNLFVTARHQQVSRGPNSNVPPAPARWVVLREKTTGTSPGFTARATPTTRPGSCSSIRRNIQGRAPPDVEIATKLFWALGYNQVETFITTFDPAHVTIDPSATIRLESIGRPDATQEGMRARARTRRAVGASGQDTYRASSPGRDRRQSHRQLPLRRHPIWQGRSQRPRPARAPARTSRAARLPGRG